MARQFTMEPHRHGEETTARQRRASSSRSASWARASIKEITLRDDHPFAYQRHIFEGGSGAVSAASHGMTRFKKTRATFLFAEGLRRPCLIRSRNPIRRAVARVFAHPARFTDLSRLPLADGGTTDLHRYPVADDHEDFVMLVEAKGSPLGWTAAVRPDDRDIVLSLKNPADYPVTFLWFSNGGRDYPPWNTRHLRRARHRGGPRLVGLRPRRIDRAESAFRGRHSDVGDIDPRRARSRSAMSSAAFRCRRAWRDVLSVELSDDSIRITGDDGGSVDYPFDAGVPGVGNGLIGRRAASVARRGQLRPSA